MAQVASVESVTNSATLLWQTSTGVSPDAVISGQVFRAPSQNAPLPILIVNQGSYPVYLGGSGVTTSTGAELAAGGSLTYNVIGNDSMYAISGQSGGVNVGVMVGQQ
jgi:hypothetical protein